MAVKCNITEFALDKLYQSLYASSCKVDEFGILENYISFLKCPDVVYTPCTEDKPCDKSGVFSFECFFNVISVSASLNPQPDTSVIFNLQVADFAGGKPPFTYSWSFEDDDFELVAGTDASSPELKLKTKPGKVVELLVTNITVTVTDSEGCVSSASCYMVEGGQMRCGLNYLPCRTTTGLVVEQLYIACPSCKSLTVFGFLD